MAPPPPEDAPNLRILFESGHVEDVWVPDPNGFVATLRDMMTQTNDVATGYTEDGTPTFVLAVDQVACATVFRPKADK